MVRLKDAVQSYNIIAIIYLTNFYFIFTLSQLYGSVWWLLVFDIIGPYSSSAAGSSLVRV